MKKTELNQCSGSSRRLMSVNTNNECRSRSCAVSMNSSLSSPALNAKIIKGSQWKRWNSAGLQGDTWPSMKEFLLQRDEEAVGEFKLLVCCLQRPRRIKWLTLIYFNDLNNNTQNSHLMLDYSFCRMQSKCNSIFGFYPLFFMSVSLSHISYFLFFLLPLNSSLLCSTLTFILQHEQQFSLHYTSESNPVFLLSGWV